MSKIVRRICALLDDEMEPGRYATRPMFDENWAAIYALLITLHQEVGARPDHDVMASLLFDLEEQIDALEALVLSRPPPGRPDTLQ